MKTLTIEVTQEDIDRSRQRGSGNCTDCPIYHAIQRVPELKRFKVGRDDLYAGEAWETERSAIPLPALAAAFSLNAYRRDWDALTPITFTVDVP